MIQGAEDPSIVELIGFCFLSSLLTAHLGGKTGQVKKHLDTVTEEAEWTCLR